MKPKDRIRKIFDEIGELKCPAFPKDKIIFNAKGINHLLYKGDRSKRDTKRILTNIRLLPSAIKLLTIMPLPQEESVYERGDKKFRFWAFEGVIGNRRIKVVIRQVGNGQKHFWSVIPGWRRNRFGVRNSCSNLERE